MPKEPITDKGRTEHLLVVALSFPEGTELPGEREVFLGRPEGATEERYEFAVADRGLFMLRRTEPTPAPVVFVHIDSLMDAYFAWLAAHEKAAGVSKGVGNGETID